MVKNGSDDKESTCDAGNLGLIPGSGRFPWRKEWQPTPVFLPGEFPGQRSLAGYSPWSRKQLDMTECLTHTRGDKKGSTVSIQFNFFKKSIEDLFTEVLYLKSSQFTGEGKYACKHSIREVFCKYQK